jgi:hypothetical protein
MQSQNNVRAWVNDIRLADGPPKYEVYRTVASPQPVRLEAGWNQLFLRGYALGYDLHFGAIIKGDPATLWGMRLSATLPP